MVNLVSERERITNDYRHDEEIPSKNNSISRHYKNRFPKSMGKEGAKNTVTWSRRPGRTLKERGGNMVPVYIL